MRTGGHPGTKTGPVGPVGPVAGATGPTGPTGPVFVPGCPPVRIGFALGIGPVHSSSVIFDPQTKKFETVTTDRGTLVSVSGDATSGYAVAVKEAQDGVT